MEDVMPYLQSPTEGCVIWGCTKTFTTELTADVSTSDTSHPKSKSGIRWITSNGTIANDIQWDYLKLALLFSAVTGTQEPSSSPHHAHSLSFPIRCFCSDVLTRFSASPRPPPWFALLFNFQRGGATRIVWQARDCFFLIQDRQRRMQWSPTLHCPKIKSASTSCASAFASQLWPTQPVATACLHNAPRFCTHRAQTPATALGNFSQNANMSKGWAAESEGAFKPWKGPATPRL